MYEQLKIANTIAAGPGQAIQTPVFYNNSPAQVWPITCIPMC